MFTTVLTPDRVHEIRSKVIITLFTLLAAQIAPAQSSAPSVSTRPAVSQSAIGRLLRADSIEELYTTYGLIFTRADEEQLRQLIAHPNNGIALAAGWERVRRAIPDEKEEGSDKPDKKELRRFLGLVEGRTKLVLSPEWEASVLTAGDRQDPGFATAWSREIERYLQHPEVDPVERRPPGTTQPSCEGDQCLVTFGTHKWSFVDAHEKGPISEACIRVVDDTAFVALYPLYPVGSYCLYSLDSDTGKTRWKSEVWVEYIYGGFTGGGDHEVELAVHGNELLVFGVSNSAAYIQAFDRTTGKNLWRFSTAFFHELPDWVKE